MDPRETLGFESLGIQKSQSSGRRRRPRVKNKAKVGQHENLAHTGVKQDSSQFSYTRELWIPPAVPSYQPLPVAPLGGSSTSWQNYQFRTSFDPRSHQTALRPPPHQVSQNNDLGSHAQSLPWRQSGMGFAPLNRPSRTIKSEENLTLHAKSPRRIASDTTTVPHNKPTQGLAPLKSTLHTKAIPSSHSSQGQIGSWNSSPPRSTPLAIPQSLKKPPSSAVQPKLRTIHCPQPAKIMSKQPAIQLSAPKPSPDYLTLAHVMPLLLPSPQRLLLILDLNGTLLYRISSIKYISRPYLKEFLAYALANHSVFIWSSARPQNVRGMCENLFTPTQRRLLVGEWARDTLGLTPKQYERRVQVFKRLDQVWNDQAVQESHPDFIKGERWSQHNTLLVDDSLLKASAQPFNHIEVPEYVGHGGKEQGQSGCESILKQVVEYLEEVRKWNDVSGFVRRRRFEGEVRRRLEDVVPDVNQGLGKPEVDNHDIDGVVKL